MAVFSHGVVGTLPARERKTEVAEYAVFGVRDSTKETVGKLARVWGIWTVSFFNG